VNPDDSSSSSSSSSQDVRPETARKYPQIYQQGVRNEYFDTRAKLTQIVEAVYASIVMFTLTLFAYDGKASDRNSGKVISRPERSLNSN
jgi:hypothetical protein